MSKLANILKMIILLKCRGKMKIKDLAEALEINERMVRKYKDDLEQAGIYLSSTSGINGGYFIESDTSILNFGIGKEEYRAFIMAQEELKDNGFILIKEYESALDKIGAALEEKSFDKAETMNIGSKPNIDLDSERKKYLDIQAAIVTKKKIRMSYFSLTSGVHERVVRPYAVFRYSGFWYFIGYCQLRDEIREFKIARIKNYEILEEKFEKPKHFNLKVYMKNGMGIVYDDKVFDVKIKINYPTSIRVMEKVWVENQKIHFNDKDNSITFEAKTTGIEDIKKWVLGMGSDAEVIEPENLKTSVIEEINKIKAIYCKEN
ncbi:WYL domain-containing transcriptional regulator [Clostridium sp. A1-XYC3]|uniref:WYL domain-containing transcriptional regulator n=1 Tax=Clostridium tanneri TaxID=3037988 RepID=A0ABU4JX28_9CLOT|nr:WYL domain-containing transcriptional regulator [Clostridium sp. A1-XYC3]MDW8802506.1 WYL domain-containing transcriptional regulator [Clostridium sp. A1-XYC3]